MDDIPRHTLQYLLNKYGLGLCDEPNKLEAMLRDLCPESKREINLIIGAQKERIATDLLKSGTITPTEILFARFTQRLYDNLGTANKFAKWAVESWAFALDIIQEPTMPSKITTMDIKWWKQLENEWKRIFIKAIGINRQPTKKELMNIINLQSLDCNTTQVSNLEPVKYLSKLKILDCSFNLIKSLQALESLTTLQEINCSLNILISDLAPLNQSIHLEKLDCSFSSIDSLSPIKALTNLKILDCRETALSDNERLDFKKTHPDCEIIF